MEERGIVERGGTEQVMEWTRRIAGRHVERGTGTGVGGQSGGQGRKRKPGERC